MVVEFPVIGAPVAKTNSADVIARRQGVPYTRNTNPHDQLGRLRLDRPISAFMRVAVIMSTELPALDRINPIKVVRPAPP
jgi:hypothetical protein